MACPGTAAIQYAAGEIWSFPAGGRSGPGTLVESALYKRIAALQQLGRDTVEAVVWPMSEAAAVLLDRTLRWSAHETALEVGWLLQELEQRFGYSLEELARRFDRSVSWVSRRLGLVELLPGRPDRGAGSDEVSGAGGPSKPGGLPAHGRHLRRASLR